MAANSEKIDELTKTVAAHTAWRQERDKDSLEIVRLRTISETQGQQIAVLFEKSRVLEKSADRTWQFASLALSALALIGTLIVAFVKK